MTLKKLGILLLLHTSLYSMDNMQLIFFNKPANTNLFAIPLHHFLIKNGCILRKKIYINNTAIVHAGYLGTTESLPEEEKDENIPLQKKSFPTFTDDLEQLVEVSPDEVEQYFQTNFQDNTH